MLKGGKIMPYRITLKTNALLVNQKGTRIIEENRIFMTSEPLINIISDNCFNYGSSFEGRQKGSTYLLGTSYKPPIILNEVDDLILIPTHSVRNKSCAWIILNNILNYSPNGKKTTIEFKNNNKIDVNVSYNVFDKQVLKATRLESILRGRNNQKYL